MSKEPEFLTRAHDPADPSPWLALYLDRSTPLPDKVKKAWLTDSSCASASTCCRSCGRWHAPSSS